MREDELGVLGMRHRGDEGILGNLSDIEDLLGGSDTPDGDRVFGSPTEDESGDETDRNRPGEYPESGGSGEGRGFSRVEHEDEGEEEEDDDTDWVIDLNEDDDPRRGKHPDRSMESLYKEERRRRIASERQFNGLLEQLGNAVGGANRQQTQTPAEPEKPPVTLEEIEALRGEGKSAEAVQAQRAYDEWRDRQIATRTSIDTRRNTDYQRLGVILRRNLDFEGNLDYAQAVRKVASRLMSEMPSLDPEQANLAAGQIVGAMAFRQKSKEDLRERSDRLGESRRRQVRAGVTGGKPNDGSRVEISRDMLAGLERVGLTDRWKNLAKTPEGRKELARRAKRLRNRINEARAESGRGGTRG